MDRTYIDNHHVVERYLADKLSEDERRAFEEYFIANPEIVREIEAATRIKVGLHKLSEMGEMESLLKVAPTNRSPGYLALAASIAVIAIGAALWFGGTWTRSSVLVAAVEKLSDSGGSPLARGGSYTILRVRSMSFDAEIELPASPRAIELRVLPEVEAQPPRYRAALASIGEANALTSIASIEGLVPQEDGFVSMFFDSSRLVAGRYQLTLSGDADTSAANEVSRFRLRIKPPPATPSP